MSDWSKLIQDWDAVSKDWRAVNDNQSHACNCVGPQGGKPLCPCRMRGVKIIDGRYVETIDHGPATVRSKA